MGSLSRNVTAQASSLRHEGAACRAADVLTCTVTKLLQATKYKLYDSMIIMAWHF